jgi:hypothetical protein
MFGRESRRTHEVSPLNTSPAESLGTPKSTPFADEAPAEADQLPRDLSHSLDAGAFRYETEVRA